jgi:tRNA threonylcarbamoyladenosine biosynthesis protein TsaB
MSTILALETSSELASVALLLGDRLIARESSGVQNHSQTLLPMVQSLLSEAGIGLAQCDAIAFGSGPGSFTGVRTACGVAQGLAFGIDLPLAPIVTLLAMAERCRATRGGSEVFDVLCVLDARMGEVYWAQYRFTDEWQIMIEPTLSTASAVMPLGEVVACGNGLSAYSSWFDAVSYMKDAVPDCLPHAMHIARLAQIMLMRGGTVPARAAQPFYLRNKVAFTTSERIAKAAA